MSRDSSADSPPDDFHQLSLWRSLPARESSIVPFRILVSASLHSARDWLIGSSTQTAVSDFRTMLIVTLRQCIKSTSSTATISYASHLVTGWIVGASSRPT